MIKVKWDVEELVALCDICRTRFNKTPKEIDDELIVLSKTLILRANQLGIVHDERFRNVNGMRLMYQNMLYVATNGEQGLSSTSANMRKVYQLSQEMPDVFDTILEEFNRKYREK